MRAAAGDFLFIGGMREDYCITHDGRVVDGAMGGNAVYAAVGARLWSGQASILSRIGSNYPRRWIQELNQVEIDTQHIKRLPTTQDTRTFYAYLTPEERVDRNPEAHFIRIGRPLPAALRGYRSSTEGQDERSRFPDLAVRVDDLPPDLSPYVGVHFAPCELLTHLTVPARIQQGSKAIITLDPSERYMHPQFHEEVAAIVHGLDAFLPSMMEARSYFAPERPDGWTMAKSFGAMGCRFVIIKQGARGQLLWDHAAGARWQIPAYPAAVRDVTGAGDAFCGGFLIGLARSGDPVKACLLGAVAASLVIEGSGALYALQATPGLAEARLDKLRTLVRRI